MSKIRYKNTSLQSIAIVGVGTVDSGEELETESVIENPNLELVETSKNGKSVNKEDGDAK